MKRKINLVGTGTLTISLPSSWVKKNNLQKGEELEITEKNNELILSSEKKNEEKKEITIDIPSSTNFSRRFIQVPYIQGYDVIKFTSNDPKVFQKIEENMYTVIGFEIVEQGKGYCIVENITKQKGEDFEKIFFRLFNLVFTVNEYLIEGMRKDNKESYKLMIQIEDLANKLDLFCRRLINLQETNQIQVAASYYFLTRSLEGITDIYEDIAKKIKFNRIVNKDFFISILVSFGEMLQAIRESKSETWSNNIGKYHEIEIKLDIESAKNKEEVELMGYLYAILRYIHGLSEEGFML